MSNAENEIQRIIGSYKAAVFARDVEALMRLYQPTVRVFDTWGVWSYEGADAWRRAAEGWLGSLGTERVEVTFSQVHAIEGRELHIISAIVTYAGVSAAGERLRAMHNRITWCLRVSGHVLRIVHEHTSAPIGFSDAKAILERDVAT